MYNVGIVYKQWYPDDSTECKAREEDEEGCVAFVCFPVVEEWLDHFDRKNKQRNEKHNK
jgi:hypothetical protein